MFNVDFVWYTLYPCFEFDSEFGFESYTCEIITIFNSLHLVLCNVSLITVLLCTIL